MDVSSIDVIAYGTVLAFKDMNSHGKRHRNK